MNHTLNLSKIFLHLLPSISLANNIFYEKKILNGQSVLGDITLITEGELQNPWGGGVTKFYHHFRGGHKITGTLYGEGHKIKFYGTIILTFDMLVLKKFRGYATVYMDIECNRLILFHLLCNGGTMIFL